MTKFLYLLFAFLFPRVDGDADPEPEIDIDPAADIEDDPSPEPEPADTAAELAAERAARATERERAERLEREVTELRQAHQRAPGPSPEAAAEDAVLNDPNATDLQKWQVRANRELRAGRMDSQAALQQAQDIADRTSFGQFAVKNPPLFKRYEKRVEEEYQKLRGKGQMVAREAILRFLIGNDALEGKLTKKAPATKESTVPRGKLPGARSDVTGKGGGTSEHEKRRARLENVQI